MPPAGGCAAHGRHMLPASGPEHIQPDYTATLYTPCIIEPALSDSTILKVHIHIERARFSYGAVRRSVRNINNRSELHAYAVPYVLVSLISVQAVVNRLRLEQLLVYID